MRIWGWACLFLVVASTGYAAAPERDQSRDTISKTESRALPPIEVSERVMRQLAQILTPVVPENASPKPVRPLSFLAFTTQSRATYVPDLCRADSVVVEFAKPERGDAGPDTPVKANGVGAYRHYRFIAPPKVNYEGVAAASVVHPADDCAKFDPVKDGFFSAPDEQAANDGYYLASQVKAALDATQNPQFAISCDLSAPDEKVGCHAVMARQRPEQIVAIDYCDPTLAGKYGTCYSVDFRGGARMDIIASLGKASGDAEPPLIIGTVKLSEMIVTADPIKD